MADITYDVRHPIQVLSTKESGWKKEINIVSWNKRPAKLDIREWNADRSKMKKGITLNREEALLLKKTLEEMDYSILPDRVPFINAVKEPEKEEPKAEPTAPSEEAAPSAKPDITGLPEEGEDEDYGM